MPDAARLCPAHERDIPIPGDFWNAVSVVDSGMQDLGWIAEQRIDITQINLNKAKKNPTTVRIMA